MMRSDRRQRARRRAAAVASVALLLASTGAAVAAPVERRFEVRIDLTGEQDWKNKMQWYKAETTQEYHFSTTLKSDGKLHAANILNPDRDQRLPIKTEYYRQKGIRLLKQLGIDASGPGFQRDLSRKMQSETLACKGDHVCTNRVNEKFSTMMAAAMAPDNSFLFEGEGRYRYFEGFADCQNRIHAKVKTHWEGEMASNKEKDNLEPFSQSHSGDFKGTTTDRESLCTLFVIVEDVPEKKMYVENVYIPGAQGSMTHTKFGKTSTRQGELPLPGPLQEWINQTLGHAEYVGSEKAALKLTLPLDGNSNILGKFTGTANTALEWHWGEPVP